MKRHLREYGLAYVLALLMVLSWVGQAITQYYEVRQDALEHQQVFQMSEYWIIFWRATFENWQSEFLQLLTFVVLTRFLFFKGSHESKDPYGSS